jgi:cold shock CspA family protein
VTHGLPGRRRGRVTDFDEVAGYGTVTDPHGEWFFHSTAIADGSRTVDRHAEVDFFLAPGHLGRMEARDIRPA